MSPPLAPAGPPSGHCDPDVKHPALRQVEKTTLINSKLDVVENRVDNLSEEQLSNALVNQGGDEKYARSVKKSLSLRERGSRRRLALLI